MKLSQFRFKLPEDRIALEPPHKVFENEDGTVEKVYHRDECRLMVVHRKSEKVDMFEKDADGNDTTNFLTFKNTDITCADDHTLNLATEECLCSLND